MRFSQIIIPILTANFARISSCEPKPAEFRNEYVKFDDKDPVDVEHKKKLDQGQNDAIELASFAYSNLNDTIFKTYFGDEHKEKVRQVFKSMKIDTHALITTQANKA